MPKLHVAIGLKNIMMLNKIVKTYVNVEVLKKGLRVSLNQVLLIFNWDILFIS